MDTIETSGNKVVTLPCLINLKCRDTKHINKWQSKKVQLVLQPNKTIHITGGENKAQDIIEHRGRYNFRQQEQKQKQKPKPVSYLPHREVAKPVMYAKLTVESSQHSQVIVTIYSVDDPPGPHCKH